MFSFRLIAIVVAFVTVVLVFAIAAGCGGGGGGGDKPEPTPAATPAPPDPLIQALARHVETTLGKPFVEDCAKAQPGQDAGKICATAKGERANQRAFVLGAVASEPAQWAILEQQTGGDWKVVQTQPITRDNSAVPGVPWPLRTGVDLVVVGADPCVNVREGPALNQKAVDCIKDGTRLRLASGPAAVDNIQWWQVAGRSGWVAGDYLRYLDAAQ